MMPRLLLIYCLFLLPSFVYAQIDMEGFYNYNEYDGLCDQEVTTMEQDRKGFLWFGTGDGLSRFNGRNFKTFVKDAHIYDLFADGNDNLWVGTENKGLIRINLVTSVKTGYKTTSIDTGIFQSNTVISIEQHHDSLLWVGTKKGLHLFHIDKGKFVDSFFLEPENKRDPQANIIHKVYKDTKDRLWIGTYNKGLKRVIRTEQGVKFQSYLENKKVFNIFEGSDGRLYLACYGYGAVVFDPGQKTVIETYRDKNEGGVLYSALVKVVYPVDSAHFWVGLDDGNLYYIDQLKDTAYHIRRDFSRTRGFKGFATISVYRTTDGTLWFGTRKGVNRYNPDQLIGRRYHRQPGSKGLPNNIVNTLCKIDTHDVAIGMNRSYLSIFNHEDTTFQHFKIPGSHSEKIKGLVAANKNTVWGIFYEDHMFRYDRDNNNIEVIEIGTDISLRAIKKVGDKIWIGSSQGILIFNPKTKEVNKRLHTDYYIVDMIVEGDSVAWFLAQKNKLIRQSLQNMDRHEIYHIDKQYNIAASGISLTKVRDNLFIGSTNGTFLFDISTEQVTRISSLGQKMMVNVLIPGRHNKKVWLGTNHTFSYLNIANRSYMHFDAQTYFQNTYFNARCGLCLEDGTMMIGGKRGLNVFKPSELPKPVRRSNLVMTDIELHNRSLFSDSNGQYTIRPPYRDSITFAHSDDVFSIEFALLDYRKPEAIHYAYRLEGLSEEWVYLKNNHTATFSHLPHGTYTLKTKAKTSKGTWQKGQSLVITIKPPFWKTTWFLLLVNTLGIIILILAFYWWGRRTRVLNQYLQKRVNERTKEIQDKNEELSSQNEKIEEQKKELEQLNATKDRLLSIIAHDLKNPFNAINGFAALLVDYYEQYSQQKIVEYLRLIEVSSKNAFETLENLLYWSKANLNEIKKNLQLIDLNELVHQNLDFLRITAKNKQIAISAPNEQLQAYADKDHVNIIIRNLLANAIKFTPEKGEITVEYEKENSYVVVNITDTGVGIPEDMQKRLFDADQTQSTDGTAGEKGTGLGLILCKDFTEKNNGQLNIISEPNKGTTVILKLPDGKKGEEGDGGYSV